MENNYKTERAKYLGRAAGLLLGLAGIATSTGCANQFIAIEKPEINWGLTRSTYWSSRTGNVENDYEKANEAELDRLRALNKKR